MRDMKEKKSEVSLIEKKRLKENKNTTETKLPIMKKKIDRK